MNSNRAFVFFANALRRQLLLCSCVVLRGGIPVDYVPPSLDVIAAHVLIFQVVSVFPNINTQYGFGAEHKRGVLIRSRIDSELAILDDKPSPPGTEAAKSSGGEFFLKAREGSESRSDGSTKIASWLATAALLHLRPEERMVPVAAGIVAHRAADVLRDGVETLQKVFKRLGLEIGVAIKRLVQVGDVVAVVLVVVLLWAWYFPKLRKVERPDELAPATPLRFVAGP